MNQKALTKTFMMTSNRNKPFGLLVCIKKYFRALRVRVWRCPLLDQMVSLLQETTRSWINAGPTASAAVAALNLRFQLALLTCSLHPGREQLALRAHPHVYYEPHIVTHFTAHLQHEMLRQCCVNQVYLATVLYSVIIRPANTIQ